MFFRKLPVLFLCLCLLPLGVLARETWSSEKDVDAALKKISHSKRTELSTIGRTAGERELRLLEIHPITSHEGPGILVLADPAGTTPLATEAALRLAREILATDSPTAGIARWYILPVANPDAAAGFFAKPRRQDSRNNSGVDEDRDGRQGEDPTEDLNGDGLITTLLVPDPAGRWAPTEEGFALEARPTAGRPGGYRLETEGRDDDGDGLFNEDGPGGVNPARNFPHGFEHWTNAGGLWAGDQPESRAILEFAFDHPDIAMILVLGRVNNLREVPAGGEQGQEGLYPVPENRAEAWGLKPGDMRTFDEYRAIVAEVWGGPPSSDHRLLRLLEEDPATAVDPADHIWWEAIGKEYRQFLTEAGLAFERLPSATSGPGSPEEWGYFQFGVPTLALDFWSLPCPAAEEDSVLTEEAAQDVQEDPLSPTQHALIDFMAVTAAQPALADWRGVQPWTETETGLVGGVAPFALTTPPAAQVDSLLRAPVRFMAQLPRWLPQMELDEPELRSLGDGVFELKLWLRNTGPLPYPCAQGVRSGRVAPVVVRLEGAEILEGRDRRAVERLPAGGAVPLKLLLRAKPDAKITVTAEAPALGTVRKVIMTRGGHR